MTSIMKAIVRVSALALVVFLPLVTQGQPVTTHVSGMDTETINLAQSETAGAVTVFPNSEIEVITANDGHPMVVYPDEFSRQIFEGASLMGWYYRERTAADPNPTLWQHGRMLPGVGNASNVAVLWGDPAVASAPDQPGLVLLGSLMMLKTQFPTVAQSPCADPWGNLTGCVQGAVPQTCGPMGGACVARSLDGGKTFVMVHCFGDTSPGACGNPGWAHFYDGMDLAIGHGPDPHGFAASRDVDLWREGLWELQNARIDSTFSQILNGVGPTGSIGGAQGAPLDAIDIHVRLRVDAQDRLWRMSAQGTSIKVNILGRNAGPRSVADNYTLASSTPVLGLPPGANDPNNNYQDSIRFGPQFDFDVGKNEAGQDEMRFVYLAVDSSGNSYVQAGYCTFDLAQCEPPPAWRSTMAPGAHRQFHPTIKYGFDARPGTLDPHHWKVTYYEFDSAQTQVAVFAGDLKRDVGSTGEPAPFTAEAVTGFQVPCPDDRTDGRGYWGDYDDMFFNSNRCTFTRPFTDSGPGCVYRDAFSAAPQHVSAVEIPCDEADSQRKVTFDYNLWVNDDDFGDPDECATWGFSRSGCSTKSPFPLHDACLVSPSAPVEDKEIFSGSDFCVDNQVTGIGRIKCELQPDLRTVRVTVTAIVLEGTHCNADEVARKEGTWDIAADSSTGGYWVRAEAYFWPSNGSPYDRVEITFLQIANGRQY